jgi:hypothetical protein
MATEVDLQKLVVSLEASFVKYERSWAKAMGVTDANVRGVQQRFDRMSKSIGNAGVDTSRALDPIASQTGNIAAQFQDIAVQLQGGQSPFLIAMQQGTQLSAVLSQAKSPIAALSAAFVQMVNPISLATIATIALGGAAVQYLGSILNDGKNATDVIKEQNDVIRRVAENWGDAVPALKAYVDQLDRASEINDINKAYDARVTDTFAELRSEIEAINDGFSDVTVSLQQAGAEDVEIQSLRNAFRALREEVANGTADADDLEAMLALIAGTSGADTIPALVSLQAILRGLSAEFSTAAGAAARLRAEQAALGNPLSRDSGAATDQGQQAAFLLEQRRVNGLTSEQLALENEIARAKAEYSRENDDAVLSDERALEIAQERIAAEERRSQIGAGGKDSDREREAVLDLIAALEYEQSTLGMTEQQKAVANALRQAGAEATEKQRDRIVELVNATHLEGQAIEAASEQMREFQDLAKSALHGFISDVIAGKDATEALGNALSNIGNRLLGMGLDFLFDPANFGGARASGGPVNTGKAYLVGEKGPELFAPKTSGMIVANDRLSGGSMSFPFAPVISMPGADSAAVDRMAQVLGKQQAEFEGRVKQIVRTHGRKWK